MKIAVPVGSDNKVDSHFGHCESFGVYSISEKNEITSINTVQSPEGCRCKSDIASVLASGGVNIMLAGGIGGGAVNVLNNSGIKVVHGYEGDATDVVKQYLSGSVKSSGSCCHHHGGDHDHHHEPGHVCNH
jgi:predicted Fe-Mo cluster-binding NifX family protein